MLELQRLMLLCYKMSIFPPVSRGCLDVGGGVWSDASYSFLCCFLCVSGSVYALTKPGTGLWAPFLYVTPHSGHLVCPHLLSILPAHLRPPVLTLAVMSPCRTLSSAVGHCRLVTDLLAAWPSEGTRHLPKTLYARVCPFPSVPSCLGTDTGLLRAAHQALQRLPRVHPTASSVIAHSPPYQPFISEPSSVPPRVSASLGDCEGQEARSPVHLAHWSDPGACLAQCPTHWALSENRVE